VGDRVLGAPDRRPQGDVEDRRHVGRVGLRQRPVLLLHEQIGGPGVVDQDIEPAAGPHDDVDQMTHFTLDGQVRGEEGSAPAVGDDCGDERLAPVDRSPSHDNVRALSGETLRDARPDTAGPPGDERDLVAQSHGSSRSSESMRRRAPDSNLRFIDQRAQSEATAFRSCRCAA
jgi:hypothetical protein